MPQKKNNEKGKWRNGENRFAILHFTIFLPVPERYSGCCPYAASFSFVPSFYYAKMFTFIPQNNTGQW